MCNESPSFSLDGLGLGSDLGKLGGMCLSTCLGGLGGIPGTAFHIVPFAAQIKHLRVTFEGNLPNSATRLVSRTKQLK
jgi:hypothetical protein